MDTIQDSKIEAIYPASWLAPDAFHALSVDGRSVLVRLTGGRLGE
ncbi:hypothetical protein ABIF07_000220 [Bradyrhizobium elkanii]|jgi:hypothetical protein|nr:hypothetical protein [Bradyrhizobium elkanii]MCS3695022.1 hypothetical protein [Bradyrhizobium elkanii]